MNPFSITDNQGTGHGGNESPEQISEGTQCNQNNALIFQLINMFTISNSNKITNSSSTKDDERLTETHNSETDMDTTEESEGTQCNQMMLSSSSSLICSQSVTQMK